MKQLKTISENINLSNKNIFLRVDFNCPVEKSIITDDTKIIKMSTIISDLLKKNAKLILCSHLGRPQKKGSKDGLSFKPLVPHIEKILNEKITFIEDFLGSLNKNKIQISQSKIFLLENIRFFKQEEVNDKNFGKQLASLADIYINEAFSCSHRAHASVSAITLYLESYAGKTIIDELNSLNKIFESKSGPTMCIIGGSKISTKIDLILNLIPKVKYLVIGGAMGNNFIKHNKFNIGKSLYEENKDKLITEIINKAKQSNCELITPIDVVVSENVNIKGETKNLNEISENDIIMDIGSKTSQKIKSAIDKTKMVLWNGPLGLFEKNYFLHGTEQVAEYIKMKTLNKSLVSVAGGGDTAAAIKKSNCFDGFSYISTAGGAFLEWLEGKTLPGLKVLEK